MNVRINAIWIIAIFPIFNLTGCEFDESTYNARFQPFNDNFAKISGYDLLKPAQTFYMPEILTEISGLTRVNDSILACVQDETGIIFLYNINKGEIIERHRFEGGGDFEGIEVIGDLAYILKSNGNIYQYSFSQKSIEVIKTPLKGANDAEGLAYDPENNRLLIACKGRAGLDGEQVEGKAVYSYHLIRGFDTKPAFLVTPQDLDSWNSKQPNPIPMNKRRKAFMPSAIAVHPRSGEIYLVANVGKLLMVLSPAGEIKHCVPLSPRVFRQPEGICFSKTEDLIISNEGQDGSGKIHIFKFAGLADETAL